MKNEAFYVPGTDFHSWCKETPAFRILIRADFLPQMQAPQMRPGSAPAPGGFLLEQPQLNGFGHPAMGHDMPAGSFLRPPLGGPFQQIPGPGLPPGMGYQQPPFEPQMQLDGSYPGSWGGMPGPPGMHPDMLWQGGMAPHEHFQNPMPFG